MTYLDRMERAEWERTEAARWRSVLEDMAARSSCTRRQVGALALNWKGKVVGVGWNHVVGGVECPREKFPEIPAGADYDAPGQYCPAVHAEEAALLAGGDGVVHMVVSEEPCYRCESLMVRMQISWTLVRIGCPPEPESLTPAIQ